LIWRIQDIGQDKLHVLDVGLVMAHGNSTNDGETQELCELLGCAVSIQ
jgi:hypothetical protein